MNDISKFKRLIEEASDKKLTLIEGVRFGTKERNMVVANSEDYNIGIEYEFHPNDEEWYMSLDDMSGSILEMIHDWDDMDGYGIIPDYFEEIRMPTSQDFPGDENTLWMLVSRTDEEKEFFINTNTDSVFDDEHSDKSVIENLMNSEIVSMYVDTNMFLETSKFYGIGIDESLNMVFSVMEYLIPEKGLYEPSRACEVFLEKLSSEGQRIKKYISGDDAFEKLTEVNEFGGNLLKDMYDDISIYQFFESIVSVTNDESLNPDEIADELYDNMMAFKLLYETEKGSIYFTNDYTRDVFPEYFKYYTYTVEENNSGIFSELEHADIEYDRVETDNDQQLEVITHVMPLKKSLAHLRQMFAFIKEHGYTSNASGLHISVSTNKWDLNDINFSKLMVLMNFGYIHGELFAPRNFVENFNQSIEKNLITRMRDIAQLASNPKSLYNAFERIELMIGIDEESKHKMQSVKTGDYYAMRGRIELRYFGGTDYEDRYSEIEQELLRALHMLDVAYGDTYDKVYSKARYKYIDDRFTNAFGMSFPTMAKLYSMVMKENGQTDTPVLNAVMNGSKKIPGVGEISYPYIAEDLIKIWTNTH